MQVPTTQVTNSFETLAGRLQTRTARVGVLGLGYVGLPLAMACADAGFRATGFDINPERVDGLVNGVSEITDVHSRRVMQALHEGKFAATTDFSALPDMDVLIICVPTPLRKSRDPDLTFVLSAAEEVAAHLRPGQLVILESTTYPGSTEDIVLPRLQAHGLKVGEDFFLAYSPERVDPGNARFKTENIAKIVAGVTPRCRRLAASLYSQVVGGVMEVSNTRVAEMVKLLENTFRAVNIALVNELAQMCKHMDIDVWEVIDAAATKPFGFMPFFPGPGLGGHCIPVDPIYLQWKATIDGFVPELIHLADKINRGMPRYVVMRVMEILSEAGRPLSRTWIHVLGVAYKKDVCDTRESPALEVIKLLRERGATVSYSDPFVDSITIGDELLESKRPTPQLLELCHLALILTDHSGFDYEEITRQAPLVFDTRNATRGIEASNLRRL
ncbi:MAG: nucleotide sugar dehydrogenase [Candidatus Schekmanbacteria bacterium]|nr:nucleotide sugar dehydrogenase [Candidatus Schekmanbacteria bacterium]